MEYRHLQFFLALADELHFRRAAARCSVTPPVLTEQLKRLEDELGGQLFERTTRVVRLTPLGTAFRVEAQAAIDRLDQAKLAARHFAAGGDRTLRIGMSTAFTHSAIPAALAAFRAANPGVKLFVQEMGSPEAETAVGAREIDIGLVHPPLGRTDLHTIALEPEPLDAVYRADCFQVDAGAGLTAVLKGPLIWHPLRRAPHLTASIFAYAEAQGLTPRIVAEAGTWLAARVLAEAGAGIALIPRSLASVPRPQLTRQDLGPEGLALQNAISLRASDRRDPLMAGLARLLADSVPRHADAGP
ncbi:MAG: LysR family transcriptional regulator [Pseudomonadota bacterium]